jgi:hypothetical protein
MDSHALQRRGRSKISGMSFDNKPPLRFGDDAEGSLSNRRVIKKPRFLMRDDIR